MPDTFSCFLWFLYFLISTQDKRPARTNTHPKAFVFKWVPIAFNQSFGICSIHYFTLVSLCITKVLYLIQQSKSVIFDIIIRNHYITYSSFFYSTQIYTYISFEISFQCYLYCPQCLNILKNNINGEIQCDKTMQ